MAAALFLEYVTKLGTVTLIFINSVVILNTAKFLYDHK